MNKIRMCLKDKSSIVIDDTIENIDYKINKLQFIKVTNYNTGKEELHNRDNIWCFRPSSQE